MESTRNKLVRVKISSVILYDEEIKEYDLKLFEKLKRSIEKRGQLKNIIICESENGFECLEGSKIVRALKEIGQDSVVAYNLGVLSEEDKKIIRIEVFRDFFLTNYVHIGKLLKEISQTIKLDDVCNTIPFDLRQAKHLINMHHFDWDDFNNNKQIEGQSSLFDLIEEAEVVSKTVESAEEFLTSEKVETEKFVEKGLDELSKIKTEPAKGSENVESEKFIITKNSDELSGRAADKYAFEKSEVGNLKSVSIAELTEGIVNVEKDDSIFVDDLGKELEKVNEPIEDEAFNNLIDGKKSTESTTEPAKIAKQYKTLEPLINKKGETIKVGDKVFLNTPKKGLFEVEIIKYSENWVYFIDLSTKNKKDIDRKRFIESSSLSTETEVVQTETTTPQTIETEVVQTETTTPQTIETEVVQTEPEENILFELPPNKEFDERYGNAYEKATDELVKEMEQFLDSEPNETEPAGVVEEVVDESIKSDEIEFNEPEPIETEIKNENFFYQEKSKLVIIKNYSEVVMTALQKLCLEYAKEKFKQDFTKCEIEHKILTNGEVHIVCVSCITRFSNKISFKQEYIIDVLNKIDSNLFSKQQIKTSDFYYDYQKKLLVLTNNKEIILQNIPGIAQQILENKYNQKIGLEDINITAQNEGENVVISHIIGKTEFGVSMRILLTDMGEFLMKIDFD